MITAKKLLEITKKSRGMSYVEANKILTKEKPRLIKTAELGKRFYYFTLRDYYYDSTTDELIKALTGLCSEVGLAFEYDEDKERCTISW